MRKSITDKDKPTTQATKPQTKTHTYIPITKHTLTYIHTYKMRHHEPEKTTSMLEARLERDR